MRIGTIKEVKQGENRVGLAPWCVEKLVQSGHKVYAQKAAGDGSGFSDTDYRKAGAKLFGKPEDVVKRSDILVKVKEPLPSEYEWLQLLAGRTLYTFLHLAGVDKNLTLSLIKNQIIAIDYATVEDRNGALPLLVPMSEVAGVLAAQYSAEYLQRKHGGRGITVGRISNARPAEVLVMGGGIVGTSAARTVAGMGARVVLFDIDDGVITKVKQDMLAVLGEKLVKNVRVLNPKRTKLENYLARADAVIGAVLVRGSRAPIVISKQMVKSMKTGAVIVDVAIDQGGCVWGSKPTTHSAPVYSLDGKIYCCVPNMPSQASRLATQALTRMSFPHLLKIANQGVVPYLKKNKGFAKGLNVYQGKIIYEAIAQDLNLMKEYRKF